MPPHQSPISQLKLIILAKKWSLYSNHHPTVPLVVANRSSFLSILSYFGEKEYLLTYFITYYISQMQFLLQTAEDLENIEKACRHILHKTDSIHILINLFNVRSFIMPQVVSFYLLRQCSWKFQFVLVYSGMFVPS